MTIAEVRTVPTSDYLLVVPRQRGGAQHVLSSIREVLPKLTVRRGIGGIAIPGPEAAALLGATRDMDLKWSDEAVLFAENRARVSNAVVRVRRVVGDILSGDAADARTALEPSARLLDVLDDHQAVNVAAMTIDGGFGLCVFDEQGAGKTVTAIYAYDILVEKDEVDFALVVAPKSMIPEWPNDIQRFMPDLYRVAVGTGGRKEKRQAIRSGADILVTNYETISQMEPELRALLRSKGGRSILIVDESFYVKNLDAKRTQALRRLREWCQRAFVLCGTPAPNAPQDLIGQFSIVDFGLTFDGIDIPKDRDEARPIVADAIERANLHARHLKSDVLPDLPPKSFQRVVLPLQPEQQRLYCSALHDYTLELRRTDDSSFARDITSFLARRSALLQICSNPTGLGDGYDETPAKLLALDEILGELISNQREKVIVWSFYRASLEAVLHRYREYGAVRYDGAVSDTADRREAVRSFQHDAETMLMVANPAAAGAGLTLHSARFAVYESLSNQAAHYLQSLDRIHRRGQERAVEYLVLLGSGTIEESAYQRLVEKERAAQELLGDAVETHVTRDGLLREAMDSLGAVGVDVSK